MRTVVKFASFVFNALCWAMMVSLILFGTLGPETAFNIGWVFWGGTILFTVLLIIFMRKDPYGIGLRGSFVSLVAFLLVGLMYLGPTTSWGIVPASIVSAGLAQGPSFGIVNIIFAIVMVALFALIVYRQVTDPKPLEVNPDPDEAKVERTGRISRWITFGILGIVIIVCSCVPGIRENMGRIFAMLSSGDINAVIEYLRSYGPQAALVSGSLMVLQSLAAPIPAFIITLSNSVVFGWWQGALLSWSSAMIGAMLCFFIARILGRDAVVHFVPKSALRTVDKFFDKFGTHAILICRLLPFMSFDYVSYAAGLTSMGFWKFFLATGIGQAPATIVYSYVGGTLTGGAQMLMMGLLIAFSATILAVIIYGVFKSRNADLMEAPAEEGASPEAADETVVEAPAEDN